jgi:hypothetical protein
MRKTSLPKTVLCRYVDDRLQRSVYFAYGHETANFTAVSLHLVPYKSYLSLAVCTYPDCEPDTLVSSVLT